VLRRTARVDHPEVREIVPSDHCVLRFRQRFPVRTPGGAPVLEALLDHLEAADVSGWPPAWAAGDRPAELWAAHADLAFPLARTAQAGRWLAVTCLRRGSGGGSSGTG
jgi:hypothetical protein